MNSRGYLAAAVLVAWGAGLAAYVARSSRRSPRERLAEAALRVIPGVTWLSIERDGEQAGFRSITVDTLPRELQVIDYLVLNVRTHDGIETRESEQTQVRLSRGLVLKSFDRMVTRGEDTARVGGRVMDDTTIALWRQGKEGRDSVILPHRGGAFVGPLVPMVAVLQLRPRVGERTSLDVVDPDSRSRRLVDVVLSAESTFVVSDSAVFDRERATWRAVHRDSVRGLRLTSIRDRGFDVWVDELGRVLSVRMPGGLTARRTAFELAFENWRLSNPTAERETRGMGRRGRVR